MKEQFSRLSCISHWKSPVLNSGLMIVISLSIAFTFPPGDKKDQAPGIPIRKAAVAGSFYPGEKVTLENYVDELLRQADPPKIANSIRAIMVPHAGYIFSGPVAAYAYKAIEGRDIRTVILIGNSHRRDFDVIAIDARGAFETPLGLVPIDETFAAKLLASDPSIVDRPDFHESDHVLEVQLPFLQRVLKNFQIVPILLSGDSPGLAKKLANVLAPLMDDKTLVIASTDMSHYPPYAEASSADQATLDAILTRKTENLDSTLESLALKRVPQADTFLCSPSGVRVVMLLAQDPRGLQPILLKYANSGDSPAGEKGRVVGYGAVAFVAKPTSMAAVTLPEKEIVNPEASEGILKRSEQAELLGIARSTVESYIRTGKVPEVTPRSESLQKPFGAFVTLKENGQLRGCIGRFEASEPLYRIIRKMAVSAATEDPRFRPVSTDELGKLEYEISILSSLKKVANADEIVLGKHGVTVSKGFHHGVFLPQVATETGWSKDEFLGELCSQKAGLPFDCWKDPDVDLEIFTAEVFEEEKK